MRMSDGSSDVCSSDLRRPSAQRSAEMVAALTAAGHRVVVTGDAAEKDLTACVAADLAVDLGGRTTLPTLAALYAAARVVVVPNKIGRASWREIVSHIV